MHAWLGEGVREPQTGNSKADRVDGLLSACALIAVMAGVLLWAEGHYLRALVAAALFLVVIPWLGKRWINRRRDEVDSIH